MVIPDMVIPDRGGQRVVEMMKVVAFVSADGTSPSHFGSSAHISDSSYQRLPCQ
jgi:hypothetical protein